MSPGRVWAAGGHGAARRAEETRPGAPPRAPARPLARSPTPRAGPSAGSTSTPPTTAVPRGWQPPAPAPLGAGLPRRGPAPGTGAGGGGAGAGRVRRRRGLRSSGRRGGPGERQGKRALPRWLPAGTRPARCPRWALGTGPPPRHPRFVLARSPFPLGVRCSRVLCLRWLQVQMRVGGCEHPACPCSYTLFTQQGGGFDPLSHFGAVGTSR